MKKIFLIFVIGILSGMTNISAQGAFSIEPTMPFDAKLAFDMLNSGKSEIKGKLSYKAGPLGKQLSIDPGTIVTLYPITPYFAEFLELRKKDKRSKQRASISSLANSYRISSKTFNFSGDFVFIGLRPGKYYLEADHPMMAGSLLGVYYGIAEIKTDGEIVNFELNKFLKYQR